MSASAALAVPGPKVVIVGASGHLGTPTVRSLSGLIGAENITVVTRDPSTAVAEQFASLGVTVVEGGYKSVESMVKPFTGASAVFLITPGSEDRAALVANGVAAAKSARVPFMLVVSVPTAGEATVFGAQFGDIEDRVKASGVPYALLHIPMFTDDLICTHASDIKAGQIHAPIDPSKRYTSVAVRDIGEAAAAILADPGSHGGLGKTYTLAGPAYTQEQLAAAFSRSLGKRVSYAQVTYDAAKTAFLRKGWQEWQAVAVLEVFKAIDSGRYAFKSDLKSLIGREGMGVEEWVEANKSYFE